MKLTKGLFLFSFSFFFHISNAQIGEIPKKSNEIRVLGVTFKEVVNVLLDNGYVIEKIDSNFQTIKTDFKIGKDKNKWMALRIYARLKDSVVILSGEWYNKLFIGNKLLNIEQTIDNSTYPIEFSSGNSKRCFLELDYLARSFNKKLYYISNK